MPDRLVSNSNRKETTDSENTVQSSKTGVDVTKKSTKKRRKESESESDDNITEQYTIGTDTIIYDEKSGIWKIKD